MKVNVVGRGIAGLTTAIILAEQGCDVRVLSKDPVERTVSIVAAAIWHPCLAYPADKVLLWGKRTYEVLTAAAHAGEAGVIMRDGIDIFTHQQASPMWSRYVQNFRRLTPEELPSGYSDGFGYSTPVIEMRPYLHFLEQRFLALGGQFVEQELRSIDEALNNADVAINCTGLAARDLVGDSSVYPIRGQIVRVSLPPQPRFVWDDDEHRGFTYIIPRANDCILGGTVEPDNWSLEPNPAMAQNILERCARLEPALRDSVVFEHLVGLRPARPTVRVEAEARADGRLVFHNYGHGGSGVTLAWGCAEEVGALVAKYGNRSHWLEKAHLITAAAGTTRSA